MNRPAANWRSDLATRADGPAAFLDDLETSLSQQLALAAADDDEGLLALARCTSELLKRVGTITSSGLARHADQLTRIRDLYHRLQITIAQQRQEVSSRRDNLRRGNNALKAYGK